MGCGLCGNPTRVADGDLTTEFQNGTSSLRRQPPSSPRQSSLFLALLAQKVGVFAIVWLSDALWSALGLKNPHHGEGIANFESSGMGFRSMY
jgi:hypothetical protein